MAEQEVTLNPGESKTVSFQTTPQYAKAYQVLIDGLTGSFTALGAGESSFSGVVTDQGVPVEGIELTLTPEGGGVTHSAITNAAGEYYLVLEPGSYSGAFRKDGYKTIYISTTILEGHQHVFNLEITPFTEVVLLDVLLPATLSSGGGDTIGCTLHIKPEEDAVGYYCVFDISNGGPGTAGRLIGEMPHATEQPENAIPLTGEGDYEVTANTIMSSKPSAGIATVSVRVERYKSDPSAPDYSITVFSAELGVVEVI